MLEWTTIASWSCLLLLGMAICVVCTIVAPGRAMELVIRDAKLDTRSASRLRGISGKWNGREVAFSIDSGQHLPRRAVAQIAATAPSRVRVRHASSAEIYIGGPPMVEFRSARGNMAVWADDEMLVQQVFSDSVAAERLAITIVARGDSVEINRHSVRVEQSMERFEGEYSALFAAWRAATQLIERMNFGVPDDGHLPFFEVRDSVAGGTE